MRRTRRIRRGVLSLVVAAMIPLALMGCGKQGDHPTSEHSAQTVIPSPAEHPSQEHPSKEHPAGEHPK